MNNTAMGAKRAGDIANEKIVKLTELVKTIEALENIEKAL